MEVFPGLFVPEGSSTEFKTSATNAEGTITNTLWKIMWTGLSLPVFRMAYTKGSMRSNLDILVAESDAILSSNGSKILSIEKKS